MKISVTGALGGIGKSLVAALSQSHDVTGIVRTQPASADRGRYVASSDTAALEARLAQSDCVIHCALDTKAAPRDYLDINLALNRSILTSALNGHCRLYIFVSSQVVYASTEPRDAAGYHESQPVQDAPWLDAYTRLKLISEQDTIKACTDAGVPWLILRPTIVMGPDMDWSDGMVRGARWGLPAVARRTLNVIHADDVALMVSRLIERGVTNQIVNLGADNLDSAEYFRTIGRLAHRTPIFLPDWLVRLAGRLLPSTFWFYREKVAINCSKAVELAGPMPIRPIEALFSHVPATVKPASFAALQGAQRSPFPFRAQGMNYRGWFMPPDGADQVSMRSYSGVVRLEGDRVIVRAGTRLSDLSAYLDSVGRALPTLPEFTGMSAGACFFVEVHGSSAEYFCLYDLIEEIKYLDDDGTEIVSARDEATWAELRLRNRDFIVTELSFRTEPTSYLVNDIDWHGDAEIEAYLDGRWRENLSTTLHWYPRRGRFFAYNINRLSPGEPVRPRGGFTPFRGMPYHRQRLLLALRPSRIVDRWHNVLGPWRRVPFEYWVNRLWVDRGKIFWTDLEIYVTLEDGRMLLERIRQMIANGELAYGKSAAIGIRFAHDRTTSRDYLWIEFQGSAAQFDELTKLAKTVCREGVRFHRGKTVPKAAS